LKASQSDRIFEITIFRLYLFSENIRAIEITSRSSVREKKWQGDREEIQYTSFLHFVQRPSHDFIIRWAPSFAKRTTLAYILREISIKLIFQYIFRRYSRTSDICTKRLQTIFVRRFRTLVNPHATNYFSLPFPMKRLI